MFSVDLTANWIINVKQTPLCGWKATCRLVLFYFNIFPMKNKQKYLNFCVFVRGAFTGSGFGKSGRVLDVVWSGNGADLLPHCRHNRNRSDWFCLVLPLSCLILPWFCLCPAWFGPVQTHLASWARPPAPCCTPRRRSAWRSSRGFLPSQYEGGSPRRLRRPICAPPRLTPPPPCSTGDLEGEQQEIYRQTTVKQSQMINR